MVANRTDLTITTTPQSDLLRLRGPSQPTSKYGYDDLLLLRRSQNSSLANRRAHPLEVAENCDSKFAYQANWLTIKVGGRWYGLSKFRINMPELGIFLSRDFLNYPNKYRAWSNNPVGQVDNNGLEDEKKKKDEKEFPAPKAPTDQKGVQEEFVLDGNGQVVIAINSSKVSPDTPSYDKNKSLKQISDELNDVTRNLPPHYYEDNNSDIYRNRLYASAYQWNLNVQKLITFVEGKENRPWLLNGKASSKEEILKALRALIIWKVVILSANQQDAKDALRNLRNAIVDGGTLIFETHSDNLRVDIGTAEGLQTTPTRTDLGKILKGEKKINFILAGCSSTQENIDIIAKQATNVTVSGEVKYQHTLFPDQPGRKTPQTQEEYNKGEDIEITNFGLPIVGQP